MTKDDIPHIPPPCLEKEEVLYADDHIVVAVKPAGLLSVPGRVVKDCLVNRLIYDYANIGVVHRLDLDTSGVMVLAVSKLARSDLSRQFRERTVHKVYQALVYGELSHASGEIDLPLSPDPLNRPKQVVDHESGKQAFTRYRRLSGNASQSRIELIPLTGRSHQLRLHLASIGHPILGCDLYAHPEAFAMSDRLMLHACQLEFAHPQSGEQLTFTSTTPF